MLSTQDNEMLTRTERGTVMGDYLRRFWVPFALSSELPEPDCPPVRVTLMGESLVAFRDTSGRVGVVQSACPHRRASLFWGRNEEYGLRCVYHGWKFDAEGNCVDMPSEPPESNYRDKVKIRAYPTVDKGGVIWAYLGPNYLAPELPAFDWLELPASNRYITKRVEMTSWVQALEGGIDSAHSNFLHARLEAYRRDPDWLERASSAPDIRTRYHSLDRSPKFFATVTDYGLRVGARRNAGEDGYYWRFTHWLTPFYNLFRHPTEHPGINGHSIAWVPIDDHRCWTFSITWSHLHPLRQDDITSAEEFAGPTVEGKPFHPARNADNDYLIDREAQKTATFTGILGVQAQDLAVQESMGPITDRTQEHLGTSDTAIILVRRQLMRQAIAAAEGQDPFAAYHPDVYRTRFADTVVPRDADFDEEAQRELCAPDAV